MQNPAAAAAAALAIVLALSAAPPMAAAAPASDTACFLSSEWSGWRATPDSKAIYIRVGGNRVYRLDLAAPCSSLQQAGVHLVTKLTGPWVCHPLDLDLHVADNHGFSTACIVSRITRLTPDEAKALPKDQQP